MSQVDIGPEDAAAPLRAEMEGLLACVHCGFCLNACPTYRRVGHEGDSPRGRLDLMRAVAEGRLDAGDEAFQQHIDRCLGCRACEPVCPSGVPYGFLLERARAGIAASAGVSLQTRMLIAFYTGPLRPLVTFGSRLLRGSGVARLLARHLPGTSLPRVGMAMLAGSAPWPGLRRAGAGAATRLPADAAGGTDAVPAGNAAGTSLPGTLPPAGTPQSPTPPQAPADTSSVDTPGGLAEDVAGDPQRAFADPHALAGAYPSATGAATAARAEAPAPPAASRGRVAILEGCVQASLFARVNAATVRVLEANGYQVVPAPDQRCCGALDAHAGTLERALELARENIAAFEASGAEVVVVNAAGCGAIMKEYGEQLRHDPEWADRAAAFSARVRDVSEFLAEPQLLTGAPLPLRVTFDAPCHLHHAQRIRQAPLQLLDSIPGLERIPLPDADECCGGAGLYGVNHPGLGGHILRDKVAAIRSTGAEVVTTPNPGCMMQIGAGLLLDGLDIPVVHPIELLDESYRRAREAE